ncbi:MAG: enoyl-CoA hydratase-related protein [Acidimicrobiales bacterium]
MVASCDLAVAADVATFAPPGGRGGWFCHTPMVGISRNIGRKRAMELSLTGDAIDAETALEWGLLNSVVPSDELDGAVFDLMFRATRGSRFSKAMGKQTLYRHLDLNLPEAYRHAVEVMAATSQSHDAQEGMASFVEKRSATWEHR